MYDWKRQGRGRGRPGANGSRGADARAMTAMGPGRPTASAVGAQHGDDLG
jgi:hypothetical protein